MEGHTQSCMRVCTLMHVLSRSMHRLMHVPSRLTWMFVSLALLLGTTSGAVLAASVQLPSSTGSYFVYGNTSHTLSLNSRAGLVYTLYASTMDISETRGWMYIQTGTATCSRSRVYSGGVLVSDRIEFNSPYYPISADGLWHQDYFSYAPALNVNYPSHGYWQTHDGGSSCGYGGGVAWDKSSQAGAWGHYATSP